MSKRRRLRNTGLCDCGCERSLANGNAVWCWNCVTNRKPNDDEEQFVLHSDCNKLYRKCQCCSSLQQPLQTNDQSSSAAAGLRQLPQQQPEEDHVEESATSATTVVNSIAVSSVSLDDNDGIAEEDDSKIEKDYLNTLSEQQTEVKTLSTTDVETHGVDDNSIVALAAASGPVVMRSVEEELSSPAEEAAVLVAAAAALNDELNAQPKSFSSSNHHTNVDDEKCELELKEEKDDSNIIFGADLILVNLESSLIHAQSHIETIILRDTFIGPHHSSSNKEESSINIEYHGDNVVGGFDGKGNHVIGSSHRRLYGPVYTVRKYQPSTDEEMVYAVIIWADSTVKDKVEIEIASLDDYYELLSKSFIWMANSGRSTSQPASEDVSLHNSGNSEDVATETVVEVVETSTDNNVLATMPPPNTEQHLSDPPQQLQPIVDTLQQQQCDNNSTFTANEVDDDSAQLIQPGRISPPRTAEDAADNESSASIVRPNSTVANYKAKIQAEIREELVHPDAVFITEQQYKLDRDCAVAATRAHTDGITVQLQVAQTTFHLSSFHFKGVNLSMTLYNDPSGSPRRLEWVDFDRRSKDGYVLYLWDQRIAIMLNLKNVDTNTYQTRFFVAMTNLYMQLGDGNVFKEFVLLDILVRMDVYTHVDALVGVIATGEVRLWKHSQDHLRFLHCDFMHEIEKGENYWIARRQQFYEEKGLLYLPQRMIPRDLDAPRTRFAVSKEYITHYKHVYNSEDEVRKNFDKWTLMPGRFKSLKEYADQNKATNSRHANVTSTAERERLAEKAKQDALTQKNAEANLKRKETRKRNQEQKKKEEQRKILSRHQHQPEEKKVPPPEPLYRHRRSPSPSPPAAPDLLMPPQPKSMAGGGGKPQPTYGRGGGCTSNTSKKPPPSSFRNAPWDKDYNCMPEPDEESGRRNGGELGRIAAATAAATTAAAIAAADAAAAAAALEAKERIDAINRQREENRLQHIKELHRLQEEEEKAKVEGAKARVHILQNKEAENTKEAQRISEFEIQYQKKAREAEEKKKTEDLAEEENLAKRRKREKAAQQHLLDMQEAAAESEINLDRKAFLVEKEKKGFYDRRRGRHDSNFQTAADEKGSELFRQEQYNKQTKFDRRTHSSARSSHSSDNEYRSNSHRGTDERGCDSLLEEKQYFNQPKYDDRRRPHSSAQQSHRDHRYHSNSQRDAGKQGSDRIRGEKYAEEPEYDRRPHSSAQPSHRDHRYHSKSQRDAGKQGSDRFRGEKYVEEPEYDRRPHSSAQPTHRDLPYHGNSQRAAGERGSDRFRGEKYVEEPEYDRRPHSSAQPTHRDLPYHGNSQRAAGERGSDRIRGEKYVEEPEYDRRPHPSAQPSHRDLPYHGNSQRAAGERGSDRIRGEKYFQELEYDRRPHSSAQPSHRDLQCHGKRKREAIGRHRSRDNSSYDDDEERYSRREEESDSVDDYDNADCGSDNEESGQARAKEDTVTFNPYHNDV